MAVIARTATTAAAATAALLLQIEKDRSKALENTLTQDHSADQAINKLLLLGRHTQHTSARRRNGMWRRAWTAHAMHWLAMDDAHRPSPFCLAHRPVPIVQEPERAERAHYSNK